MDGFFYATADFFEALYPLFKAVGRFTDGFFAVAVAVLSFYWINYLRQHPDAIQSNRIEDQPK